MIHGTLTGYQRHGCRCDRCREANTAYMREGRYAGYRRDRCACGGEKYARAKRCWACRVNVNAADPIGEETSPSGRSPDQVRNRNRRGANARGHSHTINPGREF